MACVSGLTNGVYSYIDCCGNLQSGVSLGQGICLDEAYTGSSFGVYIATGVTCAQDCNQGVLSYSFQVTGVCDTTYGAVTFNPFGGIPPYTIDPVTPTGTTFSAQTGVSPITFTGLTGGTYVFRLNDSQGLQNNEQYINVIVSNCFVANAYNVSGTTCGLNNGYVNISATTSASPYTIILHKDGNIQDISQTTTLPFIYSNLASGLYYATIFDYGSVTANTENFAINNSVGVDYGFWKVNTSTCVIDKGKLAVTGLTGTPPYTFLWSNGETTQLVSGLTQGTYSVTVTDSLGCSTTKSDTIGLAQPIGLGLLTSNNPSCFSSDGSLTFTLTGGTVPFYYSATTGEVGYTLSDTFTISNLAAGAIQVLVRDANFCEVILNGTTTTINSFSVVDVNVTNSTCSEANGEIAISIEGGNNFYTYAISGLTTNVTQGTTTQSQSHSFSNLLTDTYLLVISGTGTNCSFSTYVNVVSEDKFPVTYVETSSSCGLNNGEFYIEIGSGHTLPVSYILSDGQSIINTSLTSYTFNSLVSGDYNIKIIDGDGCEIVKYFTIATTGNLIATINTEDCTGTNDGTASVIINAGNPTFTYEWSSNVAGTPTGSSVTGLSGGTYSVKITDSSGCNQTIGFEILCGQNNMAHYKLVEVCSSTFQNSVGQKRGFLEMINEGFIDLVSGYTNCVLNSAILTCDINIGGTAYTQTFYTATTLNDIPQDSLWQSTIEGILSSISEVGSYTIDLLNNQLIIKSNCDGSEDPLGGKTIDINLDIEYDINCEASANTMCFNFSSSTAGYTFTATPQGITNNKPYYVITKGGITAYVYWDDVYNVWVFSETLGGDIDDSFSTLDNFYNPNPISDMTYSWVDGPLSSDYKMNESTNGICPYKQFQTLTFFEFMTGIPYEFQ